jgi:glycosyltransferase involved in cell wall biosynthesis
MSDAAAPPSVSVVVPVRNAAGLLEPCLRALLAQDYPRDRFEIVVVDNASSDGSADVARSLGLSPVLEPRRGPGLARNRGIAAATGDVVAFTDADCEPPAGWLAALVEALRDADAVMGPIGPRSAGNRFARARAALHARYLRWCRSLAAKGRLDHLDTASTAVRRAVLDQVGGFDPEFFASEDRDLGARIAEAGRRVRFVEAPPVLHRYDPRISASMRKARTLGRMWQRLPAVRAPQFVDRHYPDIAKLLAAAGRVRSASERRRLRARYGLHLAAAALRPGFEACVRHFNEAERLSSLIGIVTARDAR